MKKITAIFICLLLVSFQTEKDMKVSLPTLNKIHNCLATIYNYLEKSNLPHQDVEQLKSMIVDADTTLKKEAK